MMYVLWIFLLFAYLNVCQVWMAAVCWPR